MFGHTMYFFIIQGKGNFVYADKARCGNVCQMMRSLLPTAVCSAAVAVRLAGEGGQVTTVSAARVI